MLRRYQLRGRSVPIPAIATRKDTPQPFDYTKGWFTGAPNDLQPEKSLRYVTDMRFDGIGKYKTRKGCDHYTVAVGETINVQVTSTTGAVDKGYTYSTRYAEKVTATASGVACRIDINLKNSALASGTTLVELYSDVSGSPGTLLARTSIDEADIASTYNYETGYTIACPTITNGTAYWVVVYMQEGGSGTMYVSSTTNSTNAKVSTDSGQSWSTTTYSLNCKLYTATAGGVKGITRVYRPDGTGTTFFAQGTNLYKVTDLDGSTTSVDSGISSSSTNVEFEFVNDILYYTDGYSKPRKYDWATSTTVTGAPNEVKNVMEHEGILFYFDADDPTKVVYSNFADYETFTSTDFLYVPAPKKSDYLTAMAKLNGVMYFYTRRNKHQLLGQDNATFDLGEANAQKGTFSQKSVVFDENYIYFASDDGIYQFNGTYEKSIAEGIIDDYTELLIKDNIHLQLHNNRLYVWYTPNGQATASECFVYNTLYGTWESLDTGTYIGRSFARHDNSDLFLQASSKAGVIYYAEKSTNDYHNLGDILDAEVRTHYDHFGTPQQIKRIPYWRPILESVSGSYSIQAGFAKDYSSGANFSNVSVQTPGYQYGDADSTYGTATYSSSGNIQDTTLRIYGEGYRWQRRYKHHAAREPFVFSGEVLSIEVERLR